MADTLVFGRVRGVGSDIPEYTRTIRVGDTITGLDGKLLKSSALGILEGVTDNSNTWDSVATIVNSKYAGWDSTKSTVDAGAASWNSAVSTLASKEAGWDSTKSTVDAGSANWDAAYSVVNSNSLSWDAAVTTLAAKESGWDTTKTTVDDNKATWDKAATIQTGGSASEFLAKDGSYYSVSFSPAGSDTQVQFNNAGVFGASAGFTYSNGLVLTAQDNTHKPLILNANASQSVNIFEINGPSGTNGSFWRYLNTGVLRAGTNGDFSQPVFQFGNSNSGFYLDANRIFVKAGGAFSGGFSSIGFTGNSALMDTIVSIDDITLPRFIAYNQTAAGLKAGLGGNSSGDIALVANNIALIKASNSGVVTVSGTFVTTGMATSRPTTVGEHYQDTAANIAANGDLVVGIRQ